MCGVAGVGARVLLILFEATGWILFIAQLSQRGYTFASIKGAGDMRSIIDSIGISNPFSVAAIETEWKRRVLAEQQQGKIQTKSMRIS